MDVCNKLVRGLLMGLLAWLLSACDQIRVGLDPFAQLMSGQSVAEVQRIAGKPVLKRAEPSGQEVWVYTLGPEGHQNYFVWFDAKGLMDKVETTLTPEKFALVKAGMTQEEVLKILGPYFYQRIYRKPGVTWEWRYMQSVGTETAMFYVEFNPEGVATAQGSRRDPRYDAGN